MERLKIEENTASLTEEELDEIHSAVKELLRAAVTLCEQHDIPYYLIEGTLLGSVRHKGFIPWDDDVDIAIPIECLTSFSQFAKNELEGLYIETAFSGEIREAPDSTRVHNNGFMIDTTSGRRMGIWIDVMHLVGMPTGRLRRKVHYLNILLKRTMVRVSRPEIILSNYWLNQKPLRRLVIKTVKTLDLGKYLSFDKALLKLHKCLLKYPIEESEYVMAYPSAYGKKEIFPKEYYGAGIQGNFEGLSVCLPTKTHEILASLYGDYMQLPPEGKRVSSHVAKIQREIGGGGNPST